MIIRRLISIDNFRIFQNWKDDEQGSTHRFGQWTVIYGPNGSGKSTLADVFHAVQVRDAEPDDRLRGVCLELTDGTTVTQSTADSDDLPPILVFNRRYVAEHLRRAFEDGKQATPLYVIGERDVALEDRIERKDADLEKARQQYAVAEDAVKVAQEERDHVIDYVKDDVTEMLGRYDPSRFNKTWFNKKKVKELLQEPGVSLEPEQLERERDRLRHSPEETASEVQVRRPTNVGVIADQIEKIARFDVTSQPLERLAESGELANWASRGLDLHQVGDSCAFCGCEVTRERMGALRRHFDASYRELQEEISGQERALANVEHEMKDVVATLNSAARDNSRLLQDLQPRLDKYWEELAQWIDSCRSVLERRKQEPLSTVPWSRPFEPDLSVWDCIQARCDEHNRELAERRRDLFGVQKQAEKALLGHIAAKHNGEYRTREGKWEEAEQRRSNAAKKASTLDEELQELQRERRGTHDGEKLAHELSRDLSGYLGHAQLTVRFERDDDRAGFVFRRNDGPASELSEGERNAIALLHFLRSLQSVNNMHDLGETCVVVDDPVSSLDQDAILSAFSFILHTLRGGEKTRCAQVIVLTHNFEFFRLWKERLEGWMPSDRKTAASSDATGLPQQKATVLEICVRQSREQVAVARTPIIRSFGRELNAFVSEYFYLFRCACESTKPDGEKLLRLTGNSTRRLFESFLRFKLPSDGNFSNAARDLGRQHDVPFATSERVIKALHGASHRRELDIHAHRHVSSLVDDIRACLAFMKQVDPGHFQGMCKAVDLVPELGSHATPEPTS